MRLKYTYRCALLIAFLFGSNAYARIGETREQCIQRYGQPTQSGPLGDIFLSAGFAITVAYTNGTCDFIYYQKKDQSKFTIEEATTIVQTNNSGGGKRHWSIQWPDKEKHEWFATWKSDDGFIAHFPVDGGIKIEKDTAPKTSTGSIDEL